jgi:hypothetical protein
MKLLNIFKLDFYCSKLSIVLMEYFSEMSQNQTQNNLFLFKLNN